jgi:hypothetical protein
LSPNQLPARRHRRVRFRYNHCTAWPYQTDQSATRTTALSLRQKQTGERLIRIQAGHLQHFHPNVIPYFYCSKVGIIKNRHARRGIGSKKEEINIRDLLVGGSRLWIFDNTFYK